jgi:hypothetical protein
MATKTKPRPEAPARVRPADLHASVDLLRLRTIAARIDTPTKTIIARVERGLWPRPVAVVGRDWYYPREWVEGWIKSGEWPAAASFHGRHRA